MTADLTRSVAVVTGASSGLGRRFATVLAASGAAVVLVARRTAALKEVASAIEAAGGRGLIHACDLADTTSVSGIFDVAEAAFGPVDILINNAGTPDGDSAIALSIEAVDRVMAVNLRAPFLLSTEMARRLIASKAPGRIVNLASVGAFHYAPNSASALYCATKAGIIRLTEALAIEWARHGINVNAIAPGVFASEMTADFIASVGERALARFPRKRFGEPEFLDSTLLYLVDPASHFVTGTCVTVDDAQQPR